MTDAPPPEPNFRRVLLGLFIGAQLVLLLGMNLFPLVPHGRPGTDELMDDPTIPGRTSDVELVQEGIEWSAAACKRYGELTGQWQGWSLFSPLHPTQSTFPVVELRWDDADGNPTPRPPVRLHSRFEPDDPLHHVRQPDTWFRLINYEFRLCQVLWFYSDADYIRRPDEWRDHVENRVGRQWKSIRAYLRWRMNGYLAAHPELPLPQVVLLKVHMYPSQPPGKPPGERPAPVYRFLARWRPEESADPGVRTVEALDPFTGRIISATSTRGLP